MFMGVYMYIGEQFVSTSFDLEPIYQWIAKGDTITIKMVFS